MPSMPPTIAVDFDGCICEFAWPKCGPPRENVCEALRRLHTEGWEIIIHTSRANFDTHLVLTRYRRCMEMVEWLGQNGIPYRKLWGKPGKPIAHFYLDDRGLLDLDDLPADHIVLIALRRFVEVEAQYAKSLAKNRAADV